MFLRFEVENHLSIRDRSEISMVAGKLKDPDDGLIEVPNSALRAVPSAVLYGANASGKSNLISALRLMRSMVVNSHANVTPDSLLPFLPFGLDPALGDTPTLFQLDFVLFGIRYNFGFKYNSEAILSEWLYSFPSTQPRMLYSRDLQEFSFGRKLKGRNQVIADLTRKNSLFLSAAAQNDHSELSPIYRYFFDLIVNRSIAVEGAMASRRFEKTAIDPRVIQFLKSIGTGVIGYRVKEEEISEQTRAIQKEMFSVLKRVTGDNAQISEVELFSDKNIAVELAHRSIDGNDVYFDLARESSGTRRLLLLLGMIFDTLDRGGVIIIDELDASLHTQACELLLSLFSDKQYNRKSAQIIATTHDTNLLSLTTMRRDQIWFCEKDADGSSAIFPLTDIHLRATDNFESGYLQGRFGALPFAGSVSRILSRGDISTE